MEFSTFGKFQKETEQKPVFHSHVCCIDEFEIVLQLQHINQEK